jgi:SAM-dependent methyltransferase
MAQNIYDDVGFFERYAQFRRSRLGLDGAPEWPAMRAMLPPVAGRRVVDLGCGYGWFCRWARGQGAAQVLGLDLSEKMLERARSGTGAGGIEYRRADLETLSLPAAAFDLAYSSLAFHYVEDFGRLMGEVRRGLAPGGLLVFSIEHPIYMAAQRPGWIADEARGRVWPVAGYQREGRRVTDWLAPGVVKFHRTIGTTLNALVAAGFAIRRVEEWGPTAAQIAEIPALAEELERPMFLLVAADAAR